LLTRLLREQRRPPKRIVSDRLGSYAAAKRKVMPKASLARIYVIFYFMRLCARARGEPHCDLVINIDRLSFDESYRREIEGRVTELTGMSISSFDCRVQRYDKMPDWSGQFFDAIEREISALFPAARAADRGSHDSSANNVHHSVSPAPKPRTR